MRTRVIIFIHVFLAIQLALPLYYYVARSDKHDERFAWRMFSPVRMVECRPVFTVGEERTPVGRLSAYFHEAWITLARRGRVSVVESMARALCERNPDEPVHAELQCTAVDGKTYTRGGAWNVCTVGSM